MILVRFLGGRELPVDVPTPHPVPGACLGLPVLARGAAPDGRLWATDGESLCRLTDDGIVDLILGQRPEPEELSGIVAFTTDGRGRFYAVSDRTGAIHVFEPDGALRHVCKPLPTDFSSCIVYAGITVAGDGSVYVSGTGPLRGYRQFSADGRRVGVSEPVDGWIGGEWHFKPNSHELWITGRHELHLNGRDGKQRLAIERRPDGNWLDYGCVGGIGIAPDGNAAVVCYDSHNMGFNEPVISLFGPHGEPIRTIILPFEGYIYDIAYNGKCIVLDCDAGLLILDPHGKSIRRLVPDASYWRPFFSPDGAELWLFDRCAHAVQRYQVP